MKKPVIVLSAMLFLLVSACGASTPMVSQSLAFPEGIVSADRAMSKDYAAGGGAPSAPAAEMESAQDNSASAVDRKVIMNAWRTLVVNDPTETAKQIGALAKAKGGWVVSSNITQSIYGPEGQKYYSGDITIRVPAKDLDATLLEIEAMAVEVTSRQLSGQDVTSEYVDLQSQVDNLQAAHDRLEDFIKIATDDESVLNTLTQLRQVDSEMSVLKGRMKYIDESADFSSISLTLQPYIPTQPIQIGGWHPEGVAKEAFEDLIRGLQGLVDFLIRFGICGIPALLILGLLVTPLVLITRTILRRARKS